MKILVATAALLLWFSASSEALKAGERYLVRFPQKIKKYYFNKFKLFFQGDLTTYDHGVRGSVYAVDGDTLRVEGFHYDGRGPDAFFYVGRDEGEPGPQGTLVREARIVNENKPICWD